MKQLFNILILLIIPVWAFTAEEDPQARIKKGNQAYAEENYESAITYYDSVITAGYESAKLYYNMGNAYFKQNELAYALLYYERAKQLAPGNAKIQHNLAFARQKQKDDIEQLPVMFYVKWWQTINELFSLKTWALLAIVFAFVVSAFWILFIASRSKGAQRRFFWISFITSIIFIILMIITIRNYTHQQEEKEAIVFASVITGKSSPDADSKDLFVIHEGLKVHILNKIGDWYEVRLPDGTVGWLPGESIKVI